MSIFEVDRDGLAKIAERRGKAFVVQELLQNAWDTDASEVRVTFTPVEGCPRALLIVEDDHPDGFRNLAHAWTLFAESEKKGDATKRGRFNLGEKLVLALCHEAEIVTTTGAVRFDKDGRQSLRKRRDKGSRFQAQLKMTRAEYDEAMAALDALIPPARVQTFINDIPLTTREALAICFTSLPTEISDEDGYLRRTRRKTHVHVHQVREGETAMLFELGIPVMETGDQYHVDVQQKVPLNMERDGVSPGYLREVRAAVLNVMHEKLATPEEAAAPWVRDAMASGEIGGAAVKQVMDTRFGKDRVTFDPSDPEANNIAMSKGMTVIHGASLTGDEWQNVRRFGAALPAGQVTPSPKPFSPDGEPLKVLAEEDYTPEMRNVVAYFTRLAPALIGCGIIIRVADDRDWRFAGCFSKGGVPELTINATFIKMGPAIKHYDLQSLNDFFIHELAHFYEDNHLAEGFYKACTKLGAKLTVLALTNPQLFRLVP